MLEFELLELIWQMTRNSHESIVRELYSMLIEITATISIE
jgi:hypothetical protein